MHEYGAIVEILKNPDRAYLLGNPTKNPQEKCEKLTLKSGVDRQFLQYCNCLHLACSATMVAGFHMKAVSSLYRLDSLAQAPSFHLWGRDDPIVANLRSRELADLFHQPCFYVSGRMEDWELEVKGRGLGTKCCGVK